MDLAAICLARDHKMPLRVFAMKDSGALRNAVILGEETLVCKALRLIEIRMIKEIIEDAEKRMEKSSIRLSCV